MRSELTLVSVAVVFLWTGCATQPVRPVIPVVNIPAVIGAEFQRSVASWNAGDLNAFMAIYAETATFVLPDGLLQGREAIREFYAPLFQRGAVRDELTLEQLDVVVLSPDAALVRGLYRNSHMGEITRRGPTTLILRRELDGWRIIHDHSS